MLAACNPERKQPESTPDTNVMATNSTRPFGKTADGQPVTEYTLTNKNGVSLSVINYGGIITRLVTPDRSGVQEDIVLGYDSLAGYLKTTPYFGAIVGRYGNRIANGKFTLDGQTYSLAQNNNGQHLHGGVKGFDKVFWNIQEAGRGKLKLTYLSKDMEEGYPGNLNVEVTYELTDDNELKIAYTATTDKKTVVNLTHHSYFNLTGNVKRDILDHEAALYSDKFVPVTKVLIPTGELKDVAGTPFDFRKATAIGLRTNDKDQQLEFAGGYDHCWVLSSSDSIKHAATVYEPASGRVLDVYTTEPGIQFYCGNFLDGSITGKRGVVYKHRFGFCLETEHFPDSPNQKSFPSTELKPGEVYKTYTTYKFSVR
ncbi:MAG TPA: aldose epimerase family protein [Cyclobacteriaceae bacterium]|nr:aldose epimerase family protein [Cyclobacteriaceae bacterium]HMV91289.1 aldose epimerase family protein [Cyclobacteriaceae bacterium]HMX01738.1 aldose epimerase family protein [Cyclobacteriaceae bacterium]HMX51415.1 aldose epimerase family protein [Cyclobacteriaceae bacterium]HMY95562.1 aldose epimerase family protein [Cyclobacteriaceae bacterium]